MPPFVATILFTGVIVILMWLDRDPKAKVSPALWISVLWISLGASRSLSIWLGIAPQMAAIDSYEEGSPVDRFFFSVLLLAGFLVLVARGKRTGKLLRSNIPILLFFLFCGLSVFWSDYPFVTLKRWTRAMGNLFVVLIVLSDVNPGAALRRVLARSGFILILYSLLLVKYIPELGRLYSPWTGTQYYTGVTGSKNSLGAICLIFGLASVWRILEGVRTGDRSRNPGSFIAQGIMLLTTLWLFWISNSLTSQMCYLLGFVLMVVTPRLATKTAWIHLLVGTILSLSVSALFLDIGSGVIEAAGRDSTLTGRTDLWAQILAVDVNRWVGAGFETFWVGERIRYFWSMYWWRPNQAHNGYLEMFVTLGWIGLALLALLMAWGYRNIMALMRSDPNFGRLSLALFVVGIIYNFTEAGFKVSNPVWITFLLAVTVLPNKVGAVKE